MDFKCQQISRMSGLSSLQQNYYKFMIKIIRAVVALHQLELRLYVVNLLHILHFSE
jgi:hypothetical protein